MSAARYDLIVIGSGAAGEQAALSAAERHLRVGVAALPGGGLSAKILREAVLHLSGGNRQTLEGIHRRIREKVTLAELTQCVQAAVKSEGEASRALLRQSGVEVFQGAARFVGPHSVCVAAAAGESIVDADRILIATGARSAASPLAPINGRSIVTSEQILDMTELPHTLLVVGGGVVGVECACLFALLGVHVTLVEQLDRLLPFADREMVEALAAHLRENRVSLRLGETVESVEVLPLGTVVANLASKRRVSADALLWAVGRQANSAQLNLDAAGVSTGSDGRITVNSNFQSSVDHIYAAGDVAGFPTLEATAMEQGRIAAARASGDHAALSNPCFYPSVLYTVPEIAFAGKTQEQLTAENVPFRVVVANFRETARGLQRGDSAGRLKLLFHGESRKVLGIHILGEGASELLHLGQAVMALGGTVDYFTHAVFNSHSLAEGYKAAVRNAAG